MIPRVQDILGRGGSAEECMAGWEPRTSQLEMALAVWDRLHEGGATVVEAPTGVGKTLAYLVPAVLSGLRVLVSTNTKALQDQIVQKDLPLLQTLLAARGFSLEEASVDEALASGPRERRFAIMKGRNNYLCLERLDKHTAQGVLPIVAGELDSVVAWSNKTSHGDRKELLGLDEQDPLWGRLDARSEVCSGSQCPRVQACFVTRMRRRAQNAHLIVVNHHLLLADLALRAELSFKGVGGFGSVVPTADVVILDEAHAFPEIASEYFGGEVSSRKLTRLERDLLAYVDGRAPRPARASGRPLVREAVRQFKKVFEALPASEGRSRVLKEDSQLARAREEAKNGEPALALCAYLEAEVAREPSAEPLLRRVTELVQSVSFVLAADNPEYVYWREVDAQGASLGASPVEVGSLLRDHLFKPHHAAVLTSATLAIGADKCAYFMHQVGAPPETKPLELNSPFNFREQAVLYLPTDAPLPEAKDALATTARIGLDLIRLLGGGALFLFTSYRAMHQVYDLIKDELGFPAFVQGTQPKHALIESFVAEAPAVLFATASFWEGVDIPGDPLRLVIVDRLPFDPPQDPLIVARSEWLEAEGKSPWAHYLLPRAILRLKQGFGRLVRSRHDSGVVAVLDRRIQTRSYGTRFVRALPHVRRITHMDDLRLWLREHKKKLGSSVSTEANALEVLN